MKTKTQYIVNEPKDWALKIEKVGNDKLKLTPFNAGDAYPSVTIIGKGITEAQQFLGTFARLPLNTKEAANWPAFWAIARVPFLEIIEA